MSERLVVCLGALVVVLMVLFRRRSSVAPGLAVPEDGRTGGHPLERDWSGGMW